MTTKRNWWAITLGAMFWGVVALAIIPLVGFFILGALLARGADPSDIDDSLLGDYREIATALIVLTEERPFVDIPVETVGRTPESTLRVHAGLHRGTNTFADEWEPSEAVTVAVTDTAATKGLITVELNDLRIAPVQLHLRVEAWDHYEAIPADHRVDAPGEVRLASYVSTLNPATVPYRRVQITTTTNDVEFALATFKRLPRPFGELSGVYIEPGVAAERVSGSDWDPWRFSPPESCPATGCTFSVLVRRPHYLTELHSTVADAVVGVEIVDYDEFVERTRDLVRTVEIRETGQTRINVAVAARVQPSPNGPAPGLLGVMAEARMFFLDFDGVRIDESLGQPRLVWNAGHGCCSDRWLTIDNRPDGGTSRDVPFRLRWQEPVGLDIDIDVTIDIASEK